MKKKYIEEGWNEFVETVFRGSGIDQGSVQYIEMRRAFYAGAASVMSSIMNATVDTTDEEDDAIADAIESEIKEWAERLMKGEA